MSFPKRLTTPEDHEAFFAAVNGIIHADPNLNNFTPVTHALADLYTAIGKPESEDSWIARESFLTTINTLLVSKPGWPKALTHRPLPPSVPTKYLHFAHVDPDDDTKIRYTKSYEHGRKHIYTTTSIGKYGALHFGLNAAESQELTNHFRAWMQTTPIHVTTDPEKIDWIFKSGPTSCMSLPDTAYISGRNPCYLYADSPNLGIAYALSPDGRQIIGRAVVNRHTKAFATVYARDALLFRQSLRNAGFTVVADLSGGVVNYVPTSRPYVIIAPYIDSLGNPIRLKLDPFTHTATIEAVEGQLSPGYDPQFCYPTQPAFTEFAIDESLAPPNFHIDFQRNPL